MHWWIYKHTSQITNKSYIGVTNNLARRWRRHKWDAHRGSRLKFHQAIRKHGVYTWNTEVLCTAFTKEDALYLEPILIKEHNTVEQGYNTDVGGGSIPIMIGKNHPLYGKPRPLEVRNKISANHAECGGANNSNAKTFVLTDNQGRDYKVTGVLKRFCKEHKLGYSTVCRQLLTGVKPQTGNFVGWEISHVEI